MQRRTAIFGGSFNPPHIGHVAICDWLLKGGRVDEVWVIPCLIHPFNKGLLSFKLRFEMCLFAFKRFKEKVTVSKVEEELGEVSFTIRTIHHLLQNYPNRRFIFVTGEDIKAQSISWMKFDEIKKLVEIISVPRGPRSPIPDVSSTEVRRRIAEGKAVQNLVPREVAVYIVTHQLYGG